MDNIKIIVMYNGIRVAVMTKKIVPSILKLIKILIPKYFQQIGDKIEEITIRIRNNGCQRK